MRDKSAPPPAADPREGRAAGAPPVRADVWDFTEGDEIAPGLLAVKLLGGGERYETYLGWHEHLLSLVVVKIVRPSLVADERALRGLAAEVRLLERLKHPVIVRGFGAVVDVYVGYLRRKLGRDRIASVRGMGYRLAKDRRS